MRALEIVFDIYCADDLQAGLRGYTEVVTVTIDSGDAGGQEGEFEEYIRQALSEWFDGAKVTVGSQRQDFMGDALNSGDGSYRP